MAKLFSKLFMKDKTDPADQEQMIVSTRSTRPAHFLFKIESFTRLSDIIVEADYESPEFECGGYKWKLSLYPKGNETRGRKRYISLYLVSAEAGMVRLGSDDICAMFKLFIFDQKRDIYLTIQDGEIRKFNSMKKKWGFTKMMSLKSFKKAKNGYLVDDCCIFGVEILVIPPVVKSASFSLIDNPTSPSFIWKIDERSSWSDRIRYSDPFTALDYQWRLSLRPDGDGMYLGLVLHESHESSNMYVNCTLSRIVNGCSVQYGEQPSGCWFGESGNLNIGMRVPISYLIDGSKGYILKETAVFEATINCISKVIST
ncbi:unnamed protein product [Rhodiola kirilowii]